MNGNTPIFGTSCTLSPPQVLQQTLRRLEKAFVSMWEQGHGFPRYKKVGTIRSFVFPR